MQDWVARIFDHPAEGPQWYLDPQADTSEPSAAIALEYLTSLFEDPQRYLAAYSDAQIGQGLWFLVDHACSGYMLRVLDGNLPLEDRLRCIRAIGVLFAQVFAPRCAAILGHLDKGNANPLNTTCYMWWDLFPSWGQGEREVDAALLSVMEEVLGLDSMACQESALHGLGHWHANHPDRVQEVIDQFLQRGTASDELSRYARSAQQGCVQ